MKRSASLLALLLLLSLVLVAFPNVEAVAAGEPWVPPDLPPDFQPGPDTWVEVTRFTKESVPSTWWGSPSGNTDYFNCDHYSFAVWRQKNP